MPSSVLINIFVSNEDGIAEKLLLFKIKFVVIWHLLIILIWRTYQHMKGDTSFKNERKDVDVEYVLPD